MSWAGQTTSMSSRSSTSSSDVLVIPAHLLTSGKRTSGSVQVEKWVGVVSVFWKPRHRRTLANVAVAAGFVFDASTDYADLVSNVSITVDKIAENYTQ